MTFDRHSVSFRLTTLAKTQTLARLLAQSQGPPAVLALVGNLGTGKTTFVQAFAQALGSQATVTSPTFTLLNHYPIPGGELIHGDFYRLHSAEEAAQLGLGDYMGHPKTTVIIEWADRFPKLFPPTTLWLFFDLAHDSRVCRIEGLTDDTVFRLEKIRP